MMGFSESAPILELLPGRYAVCSFDGTEEGLLRRIEELRGSRVSGPHLVTVSESDSESSLVIPEDLSDFEGLLGKSSRREGGFRVFRFAGVLDFSLVGVLSSVLLPLSACGISVFTVSTFETDYILLREGDLAAALTALGSIAEVRDLSAGPSDRPPGSGPKHGPSSADSIPFSGRERGPSPVRVLPFSGRPAGPAGRSAVGGSRRLLLRPFEPEDVHPLLGWIEEPRTARAWGGPRVPLPVTADWLRRELAKRSTTGEGHSLGFTGVDPFAGALAAEPAAYGQIMDIDTAGGTAHLGRLIVDPDRRGEGLGRELVEGLLEICFDDLGLRRVTLRVFRWNTSALLCYLSAGFRVEGIVPDAVTYEEESWDTVLMGCRAAE